VVRTRQGFSIKWLSVKITETEKSKLFVAVLMEFTPVLNIFGCKNTNWINLAQYGVERQFFILVVLYRRVLPSTSEMSLIFKMAIRQPEISNMMIQKVGWWNKEYSFFFFLEGVIV